MANPPVDWLKVGKVGRLTIVRRAGSNNQGRALWTVRCDCGRPEFDVRGYSLHTKTQCADCSREGLSERQWEARRKIERERVKRMRADGYSIRKIAEQIKRRIDYVTRLVQDAA